MPAPTDRRAPLWWEGREAPEGASDSLGLNDGASFKRGVLRATCCRCCSSSGVKGACPSRGSKLSAMACAGAGGETSPERLYVSWFAHGANGYHTTRTSTEPERATCVQCQQAWAFALHRVFGVLWQSDTHGPEQVLEAAFSKPNRDGMKGRDADLLAQLLGRLHQLRIESARNRRGCRLSRRRACRLHGNE